MAKQRISRVWIDTDGVYAQTESGVTAGYPFEMWERLKRGTDEQRNDFFLSYGGIHWPQLDEDLSFEGMFANAGLCVRTPTEDSVYWEP